MDKDFHLQEDRILCLCGPDRGAHLDAFLSSGEDRWKSPFMVDNGHAKNQPIGLFQPFI